MWLGTKPTDYNFPCQINVKIGVDNACKLEISFIHQRCQKFIDSLNESARANISKSIRLLRDYGYQLRLPYTKKLTDKIFELRVRGRQQIRLLYVFHKGEIAILHVFIKKTQKIPGKEITTAENRLQNLTK